MIRYRIKYKDHHGIERTYMNTAFDTPTEAENELSRVLREIKQIKRNYRHISSQGGGEKPNNRMLRTDWRIEPFEAKEKL